MHISLLIGAILNLIHFVKERKYIFVFLTAIPLVLFVIALIGMAYEFKFSNLSLIVFDFYLIFWFFFLTIRGFDKLKAIKNLKIDD
jgi:succinate dehydrogenase hydrophobic anchor subunit